MNSHSELAFITSPTSKPLFSVASRRALSVQSVCPQSTPIRCTPIMKKARRGATEESNAVDVFGGAALSQDELLAAALGTDEPEPQLNPKKKKKGQKPALDDEDKNAVDVFASPDLSQEELIAQAMGEDDESAPTEKKKKKKRKKGVVMQDDENAVDVFAGADASQEDLLADALGETEPPPSTTRKKKKKGKKGAASNEEENAVDVFAGADVSPDYLLAEALGGNTPEPSRKSKNMGQDIVTDANDNAVDSFSAGGASQDDQLVSALEESDNGAANSGKSKKKKGKKGATFDDNDNAVDVFGGASLSEKELHTGSSVGSDVQSLRKEGDISNGSVVENGVGSISANSVETDIATVFGDRANLSAEPLMDSSQTNEPSLDEESDIEGSEESSFMDPPGEELAEEEVDESFEPDMEVVKEFTESTKEFVAFTSQGRKEKSRSKRQERNDNEVRLADPKRANFGSGGEKFTSVRFEEVTMTFRDTTILDGVTWGVRTGERVGLIGENGCGKTTQLRMIAGLIDPTTGEVVRSSPKTKGAFLRQEFVDELDPTRTLREELLTAFKEEAQLIAAYKKCEESIAAAGEDMEKLESLLNELEELRVKCEEKDAWNLAPRIDKVLPGLGFLEEDNDKLVAAFSGGWKVRIGLGKVLLQDPHLLLLDEPSNHLDNESVEWLEEYLQTCKLPMVVVSHDREFLDKVCTKIVEIEGGEAFEYPGNYTTFVKLKKEQRQAWESAYERQQKFVKEQTDYIKRSRRSPARVSQVKSRERMLERMEKTGQMVKRPPRRGKPLVFRFPPAPRSGREVVVVEGLNHGYSEKSLFCEAEITIERGDRIALIGPNGCGKSTLLRLITGRESPQEGKVECQKLQNVSLAYYEQNQADALKLDITVLETMRQASPTDMRYEEIRALLGKFLFKGDDVDKKVESLSGGEKARLALAKIMMTPSNVLILDEPGNHLSISAKEMLEEALQHFDGALLLVSHDRYLISQVATQILAVEDQELVLYDGDYKAYMDKNAELKEKLQARFIPGVAEIKSAPKIVNEEPVESQDKKTKRKKNFGGSGINSGKTKEMNAKRWNRQ